MTQPTFRPRSATELVDAAVQLGRRHYAPLLALSALIAVPSLAVNLAFMRVMPQQTITAEPDVEAILGLVPAILLSMCWFYVGLGALIASAAAAYVDGVALAPFDALGRALRRWLALIVGNITASLLVALLLSLATFLLLFVLGLIGAGVAVAGGGMPEELTTAVALAIGATTMVAIAVGFLFCASRVVNVPAAIMLEELGPFAAIGRAWRLVRGSVLRVTGIVTIMLVLYFAAFFTLWGVAAAIVSNAQISSNVAGVFVVALYPFLSALLVALYYDLRIRHEGYDLELLARSLGDAPSPPVGTPELPGESARA